jgi:hypothetical protein
MSTTHNDKNNNSGNNYDGMKPKELRQLLALRGFDCSSCFEKAELVEAARKLDNTDYDEEGRILFRQLHLEPGRRSRYSYLDPIWKDPRTQAVVYVGNYQAASDRRTLEERNIKAIVNCQEESSRNFFEDDDSLTYRRFFISKLAYSTTLGPSRRSLMPYRDGFQSIFQFIQDHLDKGESVLIHCLAGAHRAGTTGVAWLMYQTHSDVSNALKMAKACRPIIGPFGPLLEMLHLLEKELANQQQDG